VVFLGVNRPATVASKAPPPAEAARISIVVLPFTNLSNDPAQDYFADGTSIVTIGDVRFTS
jgi:TolB-like protein